LGDKVPSLFVLHGRIAKKQRAALIAELGALPPDAPRVLLATGKLVGEGFDHPPLDTLVLAMPVSWKGTLQQYAGRLHRELATKMFAHKGWLGSSDPVVLARVRSQRGVVGL
jgi:superfamily II DNA or RNA helicase